jgi:hypothetical protein
VTSTLLNIPLSDVRCDVYRIFSVHKKDTGIPVTGLVWPRGFQEV